MTGRTGQLPPTDDELWSLVEAMVDGAATAAERERLEARLRAEPQARLFYVAYLDLHAHLQWRTRGEAVPSPARRPRVRQFWRRVLASPLRVALAASLLLVVGLLGVLFLHRPATEETEVPDLPGAPAWSVAVLIDNSNTVWEKDTSLPTETGSALRPGRLKLKAGVAGVAFHGGGEILLEGPADLDVSAPDQAFLHRGKMTAWVPEGGPAFKVGMPGVVVTDRGGECGLLRDDSGLTEVHVFEGQIGADPTGRQGDPLPETRLAENAGARVDALHRTLTPVPLNERAFVNLRPDVRVTDASVRAGRYADRNFGTASQLMVKNSIIDYTWETYLCFDLAGVKGKVSEARVRLIPVRVGQPFENAAALVADNLWGEMNITWDRKPPSGPAFANWTVEEGTPVEFDVTRLVQESLAGDKKLSIRIFAPSYKRGKAYVEYGSRKGEPETRPQLLITTLP
jgi:hypothetical protein